MSLLKVFLCLLLCLLLQAAPLRAATEDPDPAEDADTEVDNSDNFIVPPKPPAVPLKPATAETPAKQAAPVAQHFDDYGIAVLQELDKMNARVQKVEVPINKPFAFGVLQIEVKACRKTPPEDPPESAAYIEIRDTRYTDKSMEMLFRGWMFGSSPALSALENPNYDVWVLDCKNASAKERSASKPTSSPKKAVPDKASPKSE